MRRNWVVKMEGEEELKREVVEQSTKLPSRGEAALGRAPGRRRSSGGRGGVIA